MMTTMHLFISFFLLLLIPISCDTTQNRYKPPDNIAVDCGSSSRSQAQDLRYWDGDVGNAQISLLENNHNSITCLSATQPKTGDKIPYTTARISRSEFTYVFKVSSSGPKFIRLHFYPSLYQDFDPSKAFFSVRANQFTLLSNFSAAFQGREIVAKEFFIYLAEGQRVANVTFIPSNSPSDAYAFINGIEIVSMPPDLYYGSSSIEPYGFTFVGHVNQGYHLQSDRALEVAYRLNVGGSPSPDTAGIGMYRNWLPDDEYTNVVGALPENASIKLKFTKIANYSAPDKVYQTARSMGDNQTQNEGYNLTWNLPVDPNFTYMVRLHFCEIQPKITQIGDRVFHIFIANQTAEAVADVIEWSGGNGVPVYRDYAVLIPDQGGRKKQNLSVALHPAPEFSSYHDAILNGIEVFKLSEKDNLAGPNPDPPPSPPAAQSIPETRRSNNTAVVGAICGGVLSCVIALSVIGLLISRRARRLKDSGSSHGGGKSRWFSSLPYNAVGPTKTGRSSLPSDVCRHFTLTDIITATNNFDSAAIVGRGGFGDVYKGYIDGGVTPVAIKRLKPGSQQGAREFMTEIEMLSELRHLHLVSLIGYCNDCGEMILVYDYMSRGTLRDHLYHTNNPPLPWKQRLQICIGAAKGLHYLHAGAKHMIIHRDVKTTNILLDDKWVAKVSDFGLSKTNPENTSNTHISTAVKGSFGYLDPEYYRRQQLTEKSDVYSFGVVLLEVLCARPPVMKKTQTQGIRDQISLAGWARLCYKSGKFDQIVDQNLKGAIAPECLKKFGEVALSCLRDGGIERPSMSDVMWGLEFALQLQQEEEESAEEGTKDSGAHKEYKVEGALLSNGGKEEGHNNKNMWSSDDLSTTSTGGGGTSSFTSSSRDLDRMSSGAVFSEIMNPEAR